MDENLTPSEQNAIIKHLARLDELLTQSLAKTNGDVENGHADLTAGFSGIKRWLSLNIIALAVVTLSVAGGMWRVGTVAVTVMNEVSEDHRAIGEIAADKKEIDAMLLTQAQQGQQLNDIAQALCGDKACPRVHP